MLQIWEIKDSGKMKSAKKLPLFTAISERWQKGGKVILQPYSPAESCPFLGDNSPKVISSLKTALPHLFLLLLFWLQRKEQVC